MRTGYRLKGEVSENIWAVLTVKVPKRGKTVKIVKILSHGELLLNTPCILSDDRDENVDTTMLRWRQAGKSEKSARRVCAAVLLI